MATQETNLKSVEPRNVLTISAKYNEGRFEFIFACSDRWVGREGTVCISRAGFSPELLLGNTPVSRPQA
eukprot:1344643-Amorphochlora_amoeboformis.AAC.1